MSTNTTQATGGKSPTWPDGEPAQVRDAAGTPCPVSWCYDPHTIPADTLHYGEIHGVELTHHPYQVAGATHLQSVFAALLQEPGDAEPSISLSGRDDASENLLTLDEAQGLARMLVRLVATGRGTDEPTSAWIADTVDSLAACEGPMSGRERHLCKTLLHGLTAAGRLTVPAGLRLRPAEPQSPEPAGPDLEDRVTDLEARVAELSVRTNRYAAILANMYESLLTDMRASKPRPSAPQPGPAAATDHE